MNPAASAAAAAAANHMLNQEFLLVNGRIVNEVPVFVEAEDLERPRRAADHAPYVFDRPSQLVELTTRRRASAGPAAPTTSTVGVGQVAGPRQNARQRACGARQGTFYVRSWWQGPHPMISALPQGVQADLPERAPREREGRPHRGLEADR